MKENGVTFGTYHSYKDWKLILTNVDFGMPEPKTTVIDIPGANGVLDLTEALSGNVVYENRILTIEFATTRQFAEKDWADLLSEISNAIHGKRLDIIFDEDPEWKYQGRCTVDTFDTDRHTSTITISCDCDPYKVGVSDESLKSL